MLKDKQQINYRKIVKQAQTVILMSKILLIMTTPLNVYFFIPTILESYTIFLPEY